MASDFFMNADDVARYLHLGKNTVYQLAKSGKLASYHVGRKLKFTLEDVEAYVASTHHAQASGPIPVVTPSEETLASPADDSAKSLSQAAAFGNMEGVPFVIAGNDMSADLIASSLNAAGVHSSRLHNASYTALVNLYAGDADAALVDLYDQKTNSYNVPYACNLAPGVSVVIFRIYGRKQGFIVQKDNPKNITTWGSLLRDGVRIVNRTKGTGARVLLDEKLRSMDARAESIEGYNLNAHVASVAVRRVASGMADVTIGSSRDARHVEGVTFVPLQTAWVDLVVKKTPESRSRIRLISDVLGSDKFHRDAQTLAPCDLTRMGIVIYES